MKSRCRQLRIVSFLSGLVWWSWARFVSFLGCRGQIYCSLTAYFSSQCYFTLSGTWWLLFLERCSSQLTCFKLHLEPIWGFCSSRSSLVVDYTCPGFGRVVSIFGRGRPAPTRSSRSTLPFTPSVPRVVLSVVASLKRLPVASILSLSTRLPSCPT